MSAEYAAFLARKAIAARPVGFDAPATATNPMLFPYQSEIVRWSLRLGRAAIFADTGLGKGLMQLDWARLVAAHTGLPSLIVAPPNIAPQTVAEGVRMGIRAAYCRSAADLAATDARVILTTYGLLHHFDLSRFGGLAAEESSILKSHDGKTRNYVIDAARAVPFRSAYTATPAPNDHAEIGNHAEFLGIMTMAEMLATFFVHDGGSTQDWRMKGHARDDFWRWVASWAVLIRRPSDIGHDDTGFVLPPLTYHDHTVASDYAPAGMLPGMAASTLGDRRAARRASLTTRVDRAVELVEESWRNQGPNIGACTTPPTASEDSPTSATLTIGTATNDGRHTNASGKTPTRKSSERTSGPTTPPTSNAIGSAEPPGISSGTDSTQKHSPQCSQPSTGAAPSVNAPPSRNDDSISTTTMSLVQSEGCFATPATYSSADSATAPNGCVQPDTNEPQPTSIVRPKHWLIWVNLNEEQDRLARLFGDRCVSIDGRTPEDDRAALYQQWCSGERPVLISKPSVFGFGINMQHCADMAFVGLSDSWEAFYQAVRRCWRFRQECPVSVHTILSGAEGATLANLRRKEADAESMRAETVGLMRASMIANLRATARRPEDYHPNKPLRLPDWLASEGEQGAWG